MNTRTWMTTTVTLLAIGAFSISIGAGNADHEDEWSFRFPRLNHAAAERGGTSEALETPRRFRYAREVERRTGTGALDACPVTADARGFRHERRVVEGPRGIAKCGGCGAGAEAKGAEKAEAKGHRHRHAHGAEAMKAADDGVTYIDKEKVQELMEKEEDLVIIDVLSPESYAKAHIKGAVNIPLGTLPEKLDTLDKDATIIVYCANTMCKASTKAAKILQKAGFENVLDYKAGIEEWTENDLPVGPEKDA